MERYSSMIRMIIQRKNTMQKHIPHSLFIQNVVHMGIQRLCLRYMDQENSIRNRRSGKTDIWEDKNDLDRRVAAV